MLAPFENFSHCYTTCATNGVHLRESPERIDGVEGSAEGLVEDVTNSGASAEFGGFDVLRRALDGRAISSRELGDDLK